MNESAGANEYDTRRAREGGDSSHWLKLISDAGDNERERMWRQGAKVRYEDYRCQNELAFNVLHSTVAAIRPSVFSRLPRPDVRRRTVFEDEARSELGRVASQVIERAIDWVIDHPSFTDSLRHVVDDGLIAGRGAARVDLRTRVDRRYVQPILDPLGMPAHVLDGRVVVPDGTDETGPYIDQTVVEAIRLVPVQWSDLRIGPAPCWAEVPWLAVRHLFSRAEGVAEFGDQFASVELTHRGDPGAFEDDPFDSAKDAKAASKCAVVWELWNKPTDQRIYVAQDHGKVLRVDDDPLGLSDFFSMPCPYYPVRPTETMTPTAEYEIYAPQAEELNGLTARIRHLVDACKAVGFVDHTFGELINLADIKDNTLVPVKSLDVGQIGNAVVWWPIASVVQVINQLTLRVREVKAEILELSGVTDIRRGHVAERESATASKLKTSYSNLRMQPRSEPFAEYVASIYRIIGELVAEHMDAATLSMISGILVSPEVVALLRSEGLRHTTIKIASDATVAPDQEAEKAEASEYLTAATSFLGAAAPIVAAAPQTAPLFLNMLKAASRRFKFADEVEGEIDKLVDQAAQPSQPPALPVQQPIMRAVG